MSALSFKAVVKSWKSLLSRKGTELRQGTSANLDSIDLTLLSVKEDGSMQIQFDGISASSNDEDSVILKRRIFTWMKEASADIGAIVKQMRSGDPDHLILSIEPSSMSEAVVKTFRISGGKIKPALQCVGGPKSGKKVSDPNVCLRPPDYKRRVATRQAQRKKGKIGLSKAKRRITSIQSRRLRKANQRLKKARGF